MIIIDHMLHNYTDTIIQIFYPIPIAPALQCKHPRKTC